MDSHIRGDSCRVEQNLRARPAVEVRGEIYVSCLHIIIVFSFSFIQFIRDSIDRVLAQIFSLQFNL